jgi:hypothetical protein
MKITKKTPESAVAFFAIVGIMVNHFTSGDEYWITGIQL